MKKRKLETALEQTYTDYFSKYSMVTFNEQMRYSEAMKLGRAQDQWLLEQVSEVESADELDLADIYRRMSEFGQSIS